MGARKWSEMHAILWQIGQRLSLAMLRGSEFASDREDIVAKAIGQTVADFLEKNPQARNNPPPLGDLEGMMKTIVRRRLLDFLRQHYRRSGVSAEDIADASLPAAAPSPDDEALAAELWRTVAELPPPLPELFSDRFLHGWTSSEIAERQGLKLNTVLSHFHRGFAKLREILIDHQP